MNSILRKLSALLLFVCLLACGGGGGGGGGGSTTLLVLTLTAPRTELLLSESVALAGTLTGAASSTLTWTATGGGTVSPIGVYTAPSTLPAGSTGFVATVSASSVERPEVAASILITVGTPSSPIRVSISSPKNIVQPGEVVDLSATVTGSSNTAVDWTSTVSGSINSTGRFTAPSLPVGVTSQTITIGAVSRADNRATASTVIIVEAPEPDPVVVRLTAPRTSLLLGEGVNLAATVTGTTNTAVTWTSTLAGTINSAGRFTAPATLPSGTSGFAKVTVTATSVADPSSRATLEITVGGISLSVSPKVLSLNELVGIESGLRASVTAVGGSVPQDVSWTKLSGPVSIAKSGPLTASISAWAVSTPTQAVVRATWSQAGYPTIADDVTITVLPAGSVVVTPSESFLSPVIGLNRQTYSAALFTSSGAPLAGTLPLTWTIAPGTDIPGSALSVATDRRSAVLTVPSGLPANSTRVVQIRVSRTDNPAINSTVIANISTATGGTGGIIIRSKRGL